MIQAILTAVIAGLIAIGALLLVVGVIGGIACLAAVIPYFLYNYGLAPLFHWPEITFFQTVAIFWAVGLITRTVRSILHREEMEKP